MPVTAPSCLAKKLKEWGKLRTCQATENGKALQAKLADLAKCQTKFDVTLAKLTEAAAAPGAGPARSRASSQRIRGQVGGLPSSGGFCGPCSRCA